jgi:hypothetical protein
LSGGLIPRGIDQGVLGDLVEFVLQSPIVLDPALAFFRLLLADGLGSALARDEARSNDSKYRGALPGWFGRHSWACRIGFWWKRWSQEEWGLWPEW